MHSCNNLPDEFPGASIRDVPELSGRVEKLKTDYLRWITLYRCRDCGQFWREIYEGTGHGEVPRVHKVSGEPGSAETNE